MRRTVTILCLLIMGLHLPLRSEILKASRRVDWSGAGIPHVFPLPYDTVNVADFGAYANGIEDDGPTIQAAIDDLGEWGGLVYFPEGSYLIERTLRIEEPVILAGAGADKTHLLFDLGKRNDDCIEIEGRGYGNDGPLLSGYTKGSKRVTLINAAEFKVGDFVEIFQDNDADVMYTQSDWNQSWAEDAVGQILYVEAVGLTSLTFRNALTMDYQKSLNPSIRKLLMLEHAGIEKLHLKRLDAGDGHTVSAVRTAFCRFRFIESEMTYRTHFYFQRGYHNELRQCYIHHSHDYGGGGHGYGTDNIQHTTGNLIVDNVFHNLRHSMMVHVGATGNVFAYNYSDDREGGLCDVSLHGHYANNNLFESNRVEQVDVSDYWGPIGPRNTFLRNRVTVKTIAVKDQSHGQNVIGNQLKSSITTSGSIRDLLKHGNITRNKITWDDTISDHTIPASYYLSEKPDFWHGGSWPAIGPDVDDKIPAQIRWENGNPITSVSAEAADCRQDPNLNGPESVWLTVFPNPFNPETVIGFELPASEDVTLDVLNLKGVVIRVLWDETKPSGFHRMVWDGRDFSGKQLPSGVYLARLHRQDRIQTQKMMLLR